ncbi:MAG: RHS repeat-associated core domain-containing protein [Candidatus Zixiibacteriota bacterium]
MEFQYRSILDNLNDDGAAIPNVASRTTVFYPDGGIREYFFFYEDNREWAANRGSRQEAAGMLPSALFQRQSILGKDTICTGYDFGTSFYDTRGFSPASRIGRLDDSTWFYEWDSATYNSIIDSSFTVDTTAVFASLVAFAHEGVGYYKREFLYPMVPTSEKNLRSTLILNDSLHPNVQLLSITAPRSIQLFGPDWESTWLPYYYLCPWKLPCQPCDSCLPDNVDTIPFVKDSVEEWEYIPAWNLTLTKRTKHTVKNRDSVFAVYTEYVNDPTKHYQVSEITTYTAASPNERLTTKYRYDNPLGLLSAVISPTDDTLYYEYDSNGFLWKTVDSSLVDASHPAVETREYFSNGLLQSVTDLNGAATHYFYDHIGRDSVVRLPLESSFSTMKLYGLKDTITLWTRIDSTDTITSMTLADQYLRPRKSVLRVNDTLSIVDSVVYNSRGDLTRTSRARLQTDTAVWTDFAYDVRFRRYKASYPTGLWDSINFVDYFTTDRRNTRGQKTRVITDFFGNSVYSYLGDSTVGTGFVAIDTSTAVYDPFGNVLAATDFKGLTRTYTYDHWARQILKSDPDVGTTQTWYNKGGRIRFVRRNIETTCTYFKYDSDNRLLEEGTLSNPDTTRVNDRGYPGASDPKTVWATYRYDSYSTPSIAADTTGGLGYCKGRMTEVVDSSGYTYLYYDARGRIGLKTTWVKGLSASKKLSFTYYANDALKRVTYPNGTYTDYSYYQTGQLKGVSDIIDTGKILYEPWGAVKSIDFKNSLKTRYSYDDLGRANEVRNWTSWGRMFCRSYQFDSFGRLDTETDIDTTGAPTTYGIVRDYTHDYRGRLVGADLQDPNGAAPDRSLGYDYDVSNNFSKRTAVGVDSVRYLLSQGKNQDAEIKYYHGSVYYDSFLVNQYDARGRVTSVTKYAAWDQINWNRRTQYRYDHRNLLTTVLFELPSYSGGDGPDSVINLYNSSGEKVKQIYRYQVYIPPDTGGGGIEGLVPGGESALSIGDSQVESLSGPGGGGYWQNREEVRYYIWSGGQVVVELDNPVSVSQVNIYGLGRHLARRDYTLAVDSLDVLVTDYLGTVRSVVQATGNPGTSLLEYYPYGGHYSLTGSNVPNRRFIGKELDKTRQLDFGPRYYDKDIGRFLAPDPILSSASPYSYAEGNPVMFSDPTGFEYDAAWAAEYEKKAWWRYSIYDSPPRSSIEEDLAFEAQLEQTYLAAEIRSGIPIYGTNDISSENVNFSGDVEFDVRVEGTKDHETGEILDITRIAVFSGGKLIAEASQFLLDVATIHVTVMGMTSSWVTGVGPSEWHFNEKSPNTRQIQTTKGVRNARKEYYDEFGDGISIPKGTTLLKREYIPGDFDGLQFEGDEFLEATAMQNLTWHFVGSYSVTITPTDDGNSLEFDVYNETSMTSFTRYNTLIGIPSLPSYNRMTGIPTPGGTIREHFKWTEPIFR